MNNFKLKVSEFNSVNLTNLAGALAQSFSVNGSTGMVVNNMNINNLICNNSSFTGINTNTIISNNAFFTGINTNVISGSSLYFNNTNVDIMTISSLSSLSNIKDNSYIASPQMTLINNSYTGIMSINFPSNTGTVMAFTSNIRLQSLTGTSIQAYTNIFQLLCANTGSGNPLFVFSLPTPITLSSPPGALSVNISGSVNNNSIQILIKPSVSTNPSNISCDINGSLQTNNIIPTITFP